MSRFFFHLHHDGNLLVRLCRLNSGVAKHTSYLKCCLCFGSESPTVFALRGRPQRHSSCQDDIIMLLMLQLRHAYRFIADTCGHTVQKPLLLNWPRCNIQYCEHSNYDVKDQETHSKPRDPLQRLQEFVPISTRGNHHEKREHRSSNSWKMLASIIVRTIRHCVCISSRTDSLQPAVIGHNLCKDHAEAVKKQDLSPTCVDSEMPVDELDG